MTDTTSIEAASAAEALTRRIKEHVRGNWLHDFEIDSGGRLISPESFAYRRRVLQTVFGSLLLDRSVLVLDEASGFYPALVHRSGAGAVSACSPERTTCELITEVTAFLDVPADVIHSRMVAFHDGEPYVDMRYEGAFEMLVAMGRIWPLFGASGKSFDAIVETCAFLVADGLVFDWTDAEWATPPPPPEYTREAFLEALRKKFEYVMCYSDWLVVAVGKL